MSRESSMKLEDYFSDNALAQMGAIARVLQPKSTGVGGFFVFNVVG